ncbi:MAG: hypothetical protein ACD_81C00137G0006 [uncultured bacterium]|uniref:Prepilin-type N-terminal cleavage/methylation domain-containing protein n=1 Tax=Candidatus Wolfebacteria bacterium GW2011_GWE2_44_13 TaxID=1619017 RepID=A0A0G1JI64_9BACT|nr:MAG: hypothetical protein ACD_81C00137G0006 [uncultured bacterium]KKT43657.1 MAG: hypothetical protein UW32_C0001G0249 [Candidatus Wolfebacteria bacterium GW2011_GWE2_44_13]
MVLFVKQYIRKRKSHSDGGFTLIEMTIVIGLVVTLSIAATVFNKSIAQQILVSREHAKVVAFFVRARSAGLTIPKTDTTIELVCAYGVHIDAATRAITLFKDLGTLGGACDSADHLYTMDAEKIDQTILDPLVSVTASNITNIVFIPPFGDVIISDGGLEYSSATVTVSGVVTNLSRGVKVNTFGQITEFTPIP